jgi:hypothetical protein
MSQTCGVGSGVCTDRVVFDGLGARVGQSRPLPQPIGRTDHHYHPGSAHDPWYRPVDHPSSSDHGGHYTGHRWLHAEHQRLNADDSRDHPAADHFRLDPTPDNARVPVTAVPVTTVPVTTVPPLPRASRQLLRPRLGRGRWGAVRLRW